MNTKLKKMKYRTSIVSVVIKNRRIRTKKMHLSQPYLSVTCCCFSDVFPVRPTQSIRYSWWTPPASRIPGRAAGRRGPGLPTSATTTPKSGCRCSTTTPPSLHRPTDTPRQDFKLIYLHSYSLTISKVFF